MCSTAVLGGARRVADFRTCVTLLADVPQGQPPRNVATQKRTKIEFI